jgi:hypothetical protein
LGTYHGIAVAQEGLGRAQSFSKENRVHDAWRKGVGQIQQRTKVEIVGENDLPM